MYAQLLQAEARRVAAAAQCLHGKAGAYHLGECSGYGDAFHIPVEDYHKEHVQQHIGDAADCEEIHWAPCVTRGPQYRAAEVVDHHKRKPQTIKLHILCGQPDDVFRRFHKREYGARDEEGQEGPEKAAQQPREDCGMGGLRQRGIVLCAVSAGHDDVCTHGEAKVERD